MMKNSGTDNVIERHAQICDTLECKLVDVKIPEVILLFQLFGAMHASRTDVDARDLSRGPADRMFGRL